MSAATCPTCGEVPAGELFGIERPGTYDGVLIWRHGACDTAWPRFEPDPVTGNRRLHDEALRIIAEGES